jgi:hypothetical protein
MCCHTLVIPAACGAKIGLRQTQDLISTIKLDMVVHTYNLIYAKGIGRRIAVQGRPGKNDLFYIPVLYFLGVCLFFSGNFAFIYYLFYTPIRNYLGVFHFSVGILLSYIT